jgi:penicillin amidase
LYLLNRAKNWNDFKNAMRTFNAVCQNTIYADTAGNIGLYCAAGVPIREKGDGIAIMPGWTDAYDWKGFVPFEKLPHSYNPDSGFLSSANNKTVGNDYPYYISTWFAQDYRFRRINEMLAEKKTISIEDFKRMHADFKSKLVEDLKPDLLAGLKAAGNLNSLEKKCLQLLENWDAVLSKESAAAAIFETFYVNFVHNLFADELGDDLFNEFLPLGGIISHSVAQLWENPSSGWYDNVTTPDRKETFDDIVQQSFQESVQQLQKQLGGDPAKWHWGDIHQLTLKHPLGSVKVLDWLFHLNRGPYPLGGSYHTVCPYKYKLSDPFNVVHGASHRHIYSPGNWDESLSVIPTGTSGIPTSDYYCDQTELYVNNQYHPDYISRDLVEKNAVFVMTLVGEATGR